MSHMARKDQLIELLEAPIRALGYELVDLEIRTGGQGLLRIYIDQEKGINLDDCESVSRQLSALLDVEDPMRGRYVLEVSSPGLNRPLRTPEHFQRYCDHVVRVKLNQSLDGQRNFKGRLLGVEDRDIVVEVDKQIFRLALSEIASAQLVAEH
jgi:ribosome maturation factor RimP